MVSWITLTIIDAARPTAISGTIIRSRLIPQERIAVSSLFFVRCERLYSTARNSETGAMKISTDGRRRM